MGKLVLDRYCLDAVFTAISQSGGRQIKYARLGDGYSSPTLKKAFDLLCLANVARKVPSVDPPGLPLGPSASPKTFKVLMLDIGLMRPFGELPEQRISFIPLYCAYIATGGKGC